MEYQTFNSSPLCTIPQKKVEEAFKQVILTCEECSKDPNVRPESNPCKICRVKISAIGRYAEANVPVSYWNLSMKEFSGDSILLEKYKEYTTDIKKTYISGPRVNFAGGHGVGKTMTVTSILKKALQVGFSAQYVNLNDIVHVMLNGSNEDKFFSRRCLLLVDFVVIDEFDPRYMANDNAADLFGRLLEDVFRTRVQNSQPLFMCTNALRVEESFSGPMKASISSLMGMVDTIAVLGDDFRKKNK